MRWWMVLTVAVTMLRSAAAAESGQTATIELQMRNDARVPAHVVERSQDEVVRIFAAAGLTVRWTETAPRFTVRIAAQVLGFDRAASHVMGVALRRSNGSTAEVFFRQVRDFARACDIDLGTMLAYVIAHEIGHLLMPGKVHSLTGVMQAEWTQAVVRDAARGSLTFTEAQAARIRASF